jgi:hypothetical protein
MQKKIYRIIINILIFVAFSSFMPGFVLANGPMGKVLAGLGYGLVYMLITDVLHFFKLPQTNLLRFASGLIMTSGYLFLLNSQLSNFLTLKKGYIGNIDCIIFTIPKIVTLDTQVLMIFASALILLLCSIILEKLKK